MNLNKLFKSNKGFKLRFKNKENKKSFKNLFKKYDYDINRVVGVKGEERYILLAEKKLLRIYRDKLKSTPLLCSYIPIENAIFYSFEVERNVLDNNIDLDDLVETRVYSEAGLSETEKYLIKYEVITELKDEKNAIIQCVIVPVNFIYKNYEYILKESNYIDYLSFPAFAYKALYKEDILKKGNDLFIVILFDKIFFTFYSKGELVYINTVSGGLNKVYEELKSLEIEGFDEEIFKKLLTKKGIDSKKYLSVEKFVLDVVSEEFSNFGSIIEGKILDLVSNYEIDEVDRIFIITEYGDIPGIKNFYEKKLRKKVLGFEFYEEYNLDKLPIDPFLFLAMVETYDAYKNKDLKYNFSLFLRKPTFFYRPSGILILSFIITLLLLSLYPIYLFLDTKIYNSKINALRPKVISLRAEKNKLSDITDSLKKKLKTLKKEIKHISKEVNKNKYIIEKLYKFKYGYLPKSKELVDITLLMNKHKVYLSSLIYENGIYEIKIYSYSDANLGKLVNDLINNGFDVYFDNIQNENNKYYTVLRIKE